MEMINTPEGLCKVDTADGRTGNYIRTFTGKKFWPLDPHANDIELEDIVHALSNICRFTGHCSQHYSVAQHSMVVSFLLREWKHLHLPGLLHDAPEAYLSDIARPVKVLPFMDEMRHYQDKIERVIYHKFNISLTNTDKILIKLADTAALCAEAKILMHENWASDFEPDPKMYKEAQIATKLLLDWNISQVKNVFLNTTQRRVNETSDNL